MPSFIVSTRHLAHIAQWAALRGHVADAQQCARALLRINAAAVNYRYDEARTPRLDGWSKAIAKARAEFDNARPGTAGAYVHALLLCLHYQCSAGTIPQTHADAPLLHRLMTEVRREAPNALPSVWSI